MERTSIRSRWESLALPWLLSGWDGLLAPTPVAEPPAGVQGAEVPAGLSAEPALGLRTVTHPQPGDDFVAFTLVVRPPIAEGPGWNVARPRLPAVSRRVVHDSGGSCAART
jgi:hypothetical protein